MKTNLRFLIFDLRLEEKLRANSVTANADARAGAVAPWSAAVPRRFSGRRPVESARGSAFIQFRRTSVAQSKTWRNFGAFTLIELLIAIAISATVIATVSTLFFGAIRLRTRASEAAEQTLPVDRAVAIMKRDLLGIVPPGTLSGAMGSDAVPVGMTQQPLLEIFTSSGVIGEDVPWGDTQKIDYLLRAPTNRNASGQDLIRAVTRNLLPSAAVTPDQQSVLSGVQNLQFSYYDGTNWNDTWSTTQSNIPVAIKVSIDFATAKTDTQVKPPVQLLVPIVAWSNTNSVTNTSN